jgi:hypothetical protein
MLGFQMIGEFTEEEAAQFWAPFIGKEMRVARARGRADNDISATTVLADVAHKLSNYEPFAAEVRLKSRGFLGNPPDVHWAGGG